MVPLSPFREATSKREVVVPEDEASSAPLLILNKYVAAFEAFW